MIFITGGNGFIGSNFVLNWLNTQIEPIVGLDLLTYAAAHYDLKKNNPNTHYHFIKGCITNKALVTSILQQYKPRAIINFAAETHVDKSILNPEPFFLTNVQGTFTLLEAARDYWFKLNLTKKNSFRFIQISTDEIYGSLNISESAFTENSPFKPRNPYSASKAAANHLVQAYRHTFRLPTLITHCSNNYGPFQFPDKLIPLTIMNAIEHKPIGIYGDGLHIRDWIYVEDHCKAITAVLNQGIPGEAYNIGGNQEKTNIAVVKEICSILDEIHPCPNNGSYSSLITFIKDRPGHDRRYAINTTKIAMDLKWKPFENFSSGLRKTILWYLNQKKWIHAIRESSNHKDWIKLNYIQRGVV